MNISETEKQKIIQDRQKCVNILSRYAKQKNEDDLRAATDNSFPTETMLTEEEQKQHREEYNKKLNELRSDPTDIERRHRQLVQNVVSEQELQSKDCIIVDTDIRPVVVHARCPECGVELVADKPKMFNPFTGESLAIHKCSRCGKEYNLEHAYPRVTYVNSRGEEITAFSE